MNTVTEIIESYAMHPVMHNASLGAIGLDSLDVIAMTMDIEEEFSLYIDAQRWTVNTRVETVLGDVRDMMDPRN